ncbi:YncE family protein [Nannocystaceae bacterium ST9]
MRSAATAALLALGLTGLTSCGEISPGVDPPADRFAFPAGLLLDPRISDAPTTACAADSDCGSGERCAAPKVPESAGDQWGSCRATARWMLVTNANSDLRYNAGSLIPIDLDAFWAEYTSGAILPAGSKLSSAQPCRRLANQPQTIECNEQYFALPEATTFFGNFPGPTEAWVRDPGEGEAKLFIPVRGDPSVTWIEMSGGLDGADDLQLECGQGSGVSRCDDRHRLRFLRNDPDAKRIAREPFRVHVSPQADQPYAYVSHQGDDDMTLIALEGLEVGGDGLPAIADQLGVFSTNTYQGAFGLAQRPCDIEQAPESSLGCTRPRVYGALRWQTALTVATVIRHEPIGEQFCVGPEDIDKAYGIICDAQIEPVRLVSAGGLSTQSVQLSSSRPILADIEFSAGGDELYVVQSNPGGLLRIDTSIDEEDGEPRDLPVAQVEVCAQPTSLVIYDDGDSRLGLVTCYRTAEVFIVELGTLSVVGLVRAGTGPDAMAVDLARQVVYVANSLDATISVIDMSPRNSTRFTELARIGVQEPYTG